MIDHCGVNVSDYIDRRDFYKNALSAIGYEIIMEFDGQVAGFGKDNVPDFWIKCEDPVTTKAHVAFQSETRKHVDDFHKAGLGAGGTDNGPPGLRKHYHPNYYGAFILDPDGNNIEVVCHKPE